MKKEVFFVINFETWNRRTTEKKFHCKIKKKTKKKKKKISIAHKCYQKETKTLSYALYIVIWLLKFISIASISSIIYEMLNMCLCI